MSDQTEQSHPERLAPCSPEAEEGLLGSILMNPDALEDVRGTIQPSTFYIVRNGWIYDCMVKIADRQEAIDPLTVIDALKARGILDEVGGAAYITYLINNTPTHIHIETYARIVERAAVRRSLLNAAQQIGQLAMAESAEIEDTLRAADDTLTRVILSRSGARHTVTLAEAAGDYSDRLEYLYNHADEPLGVPSGFANITRVIGAYRKSELIIVAARPGVGKTSFMISEMVAAGKRAAARRQPLQAHFITQEMSIEQLTARMISGEAGVSTDLLNEPHCMTDDQWGRVQGQIGELANLSVTIDDTPNMTIEQVRQSCIRRQREGGLDILYVDYIQLLRGSGDYENRTQEVGTISRGLKGIAKEFNIPVMAAAQLSRAVEGRQDKRPGLADLRESGDLEQDADIVMFIYRDDLYDENSERPDQADFIIAKDRNGPTGIATLYYFKQFTRFANYEPAARQPLEDLLNTPAPKAAPVAERYTDTPDLRVVRSFGGLLPVANEDDVLPPDTFSNYVSGLVQTMTDDPDPADSPASPFEG